MTDHPTWTTLNKKQKQKMEQISQWAYKNAMLVKMKIMLRFTKGGNMENSPTVHHSKSQIFFDGNRLSSGRVTPRRAMAPDFQPMGIQINNTSRPKSSTPTAKSCPDTEEVLVDGDRPHPQMWRSLSQPSLATIRDEDHPFCFVCAKEGLVAKIKCTCKLKCNKHTQTNETKGAHKRYDALLLYYETGDVIGSKLLQRLTENGYTICTLQRENVLGEQITETYTKLILDSRYVIAVVSAELLNDAFALWVLNRAFDESIQCDYNFLLPIVLDNCELPKTMRTIGSLKVSSNNNTNIDEIYERLLVDFDPQVEGASPS
ncbi:uncharacterized protein LOC117121848 isoform X2 [Anneissia japonica]|nr:uncharacterized protein LOC117121848 isoform X2 [Anneissia japonica]